MGRGGGGEVGTCGREGGRDEMWEMWVKGGEGLGKELARF